VVAGEEIGSLADADIRAQTNGCMVVDPHTLSETDMISHFQEPGSFYIDARLDHDAAPDGRAEHPQDGCLYPRGHKSYKA